MLGCALLYSSVWCGMVAYILWYGVLCCGALFDVVLRLVWCCIMWCGVVLCNVLWCGVVVSQVVLGSAVLYCAVRCGVVSCCGAV